MKYAYRQARSAGYTRLQSSMLAWIFGDGAIDEALFS